MGNATGDEDLIIFGKIVRPHGIKGEVKIVPMIPWPDGFRVTGSIFLEGSSQNQWVEIEHGRWGKDGAVVKIRQVQDRNTAESLRTFMVKISRDKMPALSSNGHYDHELIGLKMMTRSGEMVGIVKKVLHLPAQDVYEIESSKGMVMIPAVDAFIKKIDLKKQVMVIEPIEGLLDVDAD